MFNTSIQLIRNQIKYNKTLICKRYAGHSKWANIKHTKAAKDSERSKLFTKLLQRMKVAIQEGGNANPSTNLHLLQAIEVARRNNMPQTTINKFIKSAQDNKSDAQNVWYEIRGPNGSVIVALALTEHAKKTRDTIAQLIRKSNTSFGSNNSIKHIFEHKGLITAKPPKEMENVDETIIDHAIECGAEEVNPCDVEDNVFIFTSSIEQMHSVQQKLSVLKYTIMSADFSFIPKIKAELNDEQLQAMSSLIDRLEELPDVVKVYDNIA